MSEQLKKLTGKFGYEAVAKHLIKDCETELFKELDDNDINHNHLTIKM